MLRTYLTIEYRARSNEASRHTIALRGELLAGIEFAILPISAQSEESPTEWYNGDVYSFAAGFPPHLASNNPRPRHTSALSHTVTLDVPSAAQECSIARGGEHTDCRARFAVLVRAGYDIRLFNDSGIGNPNGPVFRFKLALDTVESHIERQDALAPLPELDLVGDYVDGWLVGEHIGIGLSSARGDLEVLKVYSVPDAPLALEMALDRFSIYEGQSKILPVRVRQSRPVTAKDQYLSFAIQYRERPINSAEWQPKSCLCKISLAESKSPSAIKFTYLGASQAVNYAMLVPPILANFNSSEPTILALHGAGVQASSAEWTKAIPRRQRGWAVLPTGGTEWGLDWHGPTMENARLALRAARTAVNGLESFAGRRMNETTM